MDTSISIGDEMDIKQAIIRWDGMCPQEEHGMSWNDFLMNLKTRFFVDESVLYVVSRILSEPIGVFLENSTWTSMYIEGSTVGDLSILFPMGCDKCFFSYNKGG